MARMTENQVAWAKSHDWFVGVTRSGTVVAEDVAVHRDGTVTRNWVSFTNFRAMRSWAGY